MKNLICFVIMILITVSVFSTTLVVDKFNGPYYTINAAYSASADGDVILIYPATYLESISISKAITLEGIDPNSTVIQTNSSYAIKINNGNVTILNLKIICTNKGIEIYASTPIIKHCIIENCTDGIFIDEEYITVNNCIIRNCSKGITFDYAINFNTFGGTIINNVIQNCSSGISMRTASSGSADCYANIYSNIIINSTNYGIINYNGGSYMGTLDYNCFNNNVTNTSGVNTGSNNIYQDPIFFDLVESNYYLQSGSPCIDSGITGFEYEDLDGTRNDMGIYGGPQQWGSGYPTVMDIQITPESVYPGETFDIEATGQIK